jgi:hypothetical protein
MKIAALMGDREFIGDAWMAYLQRENIPFILRLRENQHVLREGYQRRHDANDSVSTGETLDARREKSRRGDTSYNREREMEA